LLAAGDEADKLYRYYESRDPNWAAKFRVQKGEILVWRGLSRDALAVLSPDLPEPLRSDAISVRRYVALGLANCFLQQFNDAERLLANADELARAKHPELLSEVTLAQGTLLLLRNSFSDAQNRFRGALELARRDQQPFVEANALGSLGVAAMRQQHYDQAIDWLQASLTISHQLGNPTQEEKTLGNLGWTYYKLGDFEKALSLFQQAAKICTEQGLVKDEQIWLSNSGLIYSTLGDLDRGEKNYLAALDIARKLENKALIAITLNNVSRLELARGKLQDAQRDTSEALSLSKADGFRSSEFYALIGMARIELAQKKYEEAERRLREVVEGKDSDASLRWESEATLAQVYVASKKYAAADTHFRKAIGMIDQAREALGKTDYRLSFLATATEFYDDYIDFLVSRNRTEDALWVAEHSRARTLAEGLGISPATLGTSVVRPTEIAKRRNAVILAYWLKPERSYLWVITGAGVSLISLPDRAEIESAVQAYRSALMGPRDPLRAANGAGEKLFQELVAPAQRLIPTTSPVIVVADGALHGLNFETLINPNPSRHYWIEDVTISNASSLALLEGPPSPGESKREPSLLLVGNPVPVSNEFPALFQAEEEMHDVSAHFPPNRETILDGAKATPAAYLANDPGAFTNIHFVAHGTASRVSPLESAVVLSSDGNDYKLYAREIIEKPLRADLVTISACYGSGSRAYSGEGLVGLSWSFLRAGAHNVVAALWEANDVSTPKLMNGMYAAIASGESPASALRKAKLTMLRSDSVFRRPFYWAPFQLYEGFGRPTRVSRGQS